ncbi:MAG: hypothetical protein P1U46_03010 [Patescibacteria group bacterium]|nr:hypothetical protein [Patescibacteria group bacterium]
MKYKNNNINKTISEIEKLLITNDQINTKIIKENIIPELEESIFELIDNIMNLEIHNSLKNIDIILCYTNIYSFYNNLLANLRVNVFILKLKKERVNNNDI